MQPSNFDQDGDGKALPKAEKDDSFDAQELWRRPKGFNVFVRRDPKHCEAVEREKDGDVVDDRDVRVCFTSQRAMKASECDQHPASFSSDPSLYVPRSLSTTVAIAKTGLI